MAILSTSTCGSDVISYNAVGWGQWGQWGQWKCRVAVCGLQARHSILKELDVIPPVLACSCGWFFRLEKRRVLGFVERGTSAKKGVCR